MAKWRNETGRILYAGGYKWKLEQERDLDATDEQAAEFTERGIVKVTSVKRRRSVGVKGPNETDGGN